MGRAPCCAEGKDEPGAVVRRGAWTAEEDAKLVAFIKQNKGHGSWRTLPKLAGLERCGKSCRLRWTNYLRPNIKRGNFSAEEEHIVIQLHAVVGNKWSSIASHLPGRTDNEIKNHWNTHLKKRLTRMGIDPMTHLPLSFLVPRHHHLYGNLVASNQSNYINTYSEWQKALLQRSLQLNPTFACHLAQWELARVEAEARQRLVNSHETHIQNCYASWLQSLQQNQSPTYDLNAFLHATSLQPQALFSNPLATPSEMVPNEHSKQDAQTYTNNLFKSYYPSSSCKGNDMSPSTLNKACPTLNTEGIAHICEDHAHTSPTSSIATPDTCSSSDSLSSHILPSEFVIPNDLISLDLSSNDSCNPVTETDAHESSPISTHDQAIQHDSYWNKLLDLLGQVSFENL